jgi:hypothetical protein
MLRADYILSKHKGRDLMRRNILALTTLVTASSMLLISHAKALEKFHAVLSGFEEIGALGAGETGAIFSPGKGTLDLVLDDELHTLSFTLTYSGLSAPVLKAHIHFGKEHVAGGVMVFFCTSDPTDTPPPGTQKCTSPSATVTGTLTAGSVVGPTKQNVPVGDFDAVVAALRSNTAYANIHSDNFPSGEIRGQVRRPKDDGH